MEVSEISIGTHIKNHSIDPAAMVNYRKKLRPSRDQEEKGEHQIYREVASIATELPV